MLPFFRSIRSPTPRAATTSKNHHHIPTHSRSTETTLPSHLLHRHLHPPPSPPPQQPLRATISTSPSPRGKGCVRFCLQSKGAFDFCINPRRVRLVLVAPQKGSLGLTESPSRPAKLRPPSPPLTAVSGDFSGEPQKCSPSSDLYDPPHHAPPPPPKIITTSPPTVDPPKPRCHHIYSIATSIRHPHHLHNSRFAPPSPPRHHQEGALICCSAAARAAFGIYNTKQGVFSFIYRKGCVRFCLQSKGAFDFCINPRRVCLVLVAPQKGSLGLTESPSR
nr:hypothetical protein [Tanacetum cinerariifolium]